MRRYAIPALACLGLVGFAACSPDEGDFASEAEDFIEDEDGEVANQTGLTFTDASCDEPASTDEGSTFTCTATGSDGTAYEFSAKITGSNSFEIGSMTPAGGSTPPGTTGTAGTAGSVPATTGG